MSKSNSDVESYGTLLKSLPDGSHIRVDFWNDFILPQSWTFADRVNDNFHLAYIRKGSGCYLLGDRREEMTEGKIIFVSSGFPHSRLLGPCDRPHIFLLRFSILGNGTPAPVPLPCKPFAFAHTPANRAVFFRLFGLLGDMLKNGSPDEFPFPQLCGGMVTQILLALYASFAPQERPAAGDPRITYAMKYMADNLGGNIRLDDLAARSGLSRNYFRALFKAQSGLNPKEYLIQLKLCRARELLCETDRKIRSIACDLGYSDQYAFSKQFREYMGVAPLGLRNRLQPAAGRKQA